MNLTGKFIIVLLLTGFINPLTSAASPPGKVDRPEYETEHFKLRLFPRTPNQMAAFYTGRGFPAFAIDEVRQVCFITILLKNKGKDIVWFDLKNWRFTTEAGELKRYLRSHWKQRWTELGLEKRFQSTFRWTLMPEQLDFRPYEGEGGNIILPRTDKPITIQASLAIGERRSKVYDITIKNVSCASDP